MVKASQMQPASQMMTAGGTHSMAITDQGVRVSLYCIGRQNGFRIEVTNVGEMGKIFIGLFILTVSARVLHSGSVGIMNPHIQMTAAFDGD